MGLNYTVRLQRTPLQAIKLQPPGKTTDTGYLKLAETYCTSYLSLGLFVIVLIKASTLLQAQLRGHLQLSGPLAASLRASPRHAAGGGGAALVGSKHGALSIMAFWTSLLAVTTLRLADLLRSMQETQEELLL